MSLIIFSLNFIWIIEIDNLKSLLRSIWKYQCSLAKNLSIKKKNLIIFLKHSNVTNNYSRFSLCPLLKLCNSIFVLFHNTAGCNTTTGLSKATSFCTFQEHLIALTLQPLTLIHILNTYFISKFQTLIIMNEDK